MSDVYSGFFTIRPATAEEKAADDECYNCGAEVAYFVEPHGAVICMRCAQQDLALNLGAHATPAGSGYIPASLTPEQFAQVSSMTIPPGCILFRPFVSARMEPIEGGHHRRRITIEYEVAEGDPL